MTMAQCEVTERAVPQARRLFFALWPSDAVRAAIEATAGPLIEHAGGRVTASENFHITLMFLGSVPQERLDMLLRVAATMRGEDCELQLNRAERWPGARLLCLTASDPPAALLSFQDRLRQCVSEEPPPGEQHPFRPHVTLARRVARMGRPMQIEPLRWHVVDFVLAESQPTFRGSKYKILARWPLQPTQ